MAHFLIDASLPRSSAQMFIARGHAATDVRDIGLGDAEDEVIAAHAKSSQMAIATRDGDFGDIRNYPPEEYQGIVVVDVPDNFTASQIVATLAAFLDGSAEFDFTQKLIILEPGWVLVIVNAEACIECREPYYSTDTLRYLEQLRIEFMGGEIIPPAVGRVYEISGPELKR